VVALSPWPATGPFGWACYRRGGATYHRGHSPFGVCGRHHPRRTHTGGWGIGRSGGVDAGSRGARPGGRVPV